MLAGASEGQTQTRNTPKGGQSMLTASLPESALESRSPDALFGLRNLNGLLDVLYHFVS